MRIEMKFIRQLALGVLRNLVADLLQIAFNRLGFGRIGEALRFLECEEQSIARADFLFS